MSKTAIIITSTDTTSKTLQKNITDVNPEATNTQLVTFAQGLNALTTNTYNGTSRVNKINCDSEASAAVKTTPTLAFKNADKTSTITALSRTDENYFDSAGTGNTSRKTLSIPVYYDGDGLLGVHFDSTTTNCTIRTDTTNYYVLSIMWFLNAIPSDAFNFTLTASEGANYKAATTTFTVNP